MLLSDLLRKRVEWVDDIPHREEVVKFHVREEVSAPVHEEKESEDTLPHEGLPLFRLLL